MADKPIENDDVDEDVIEAPIVAAPMERRPPRKPGPRGGGQPYRGPGRGGSADEDGGGRGGKRPGYFQGRRKVCPIKIEEVSWKNMDALRYFVNENGNIRSRRKTGANAKLQRRVAVAVKRARHMALLPYTGEHVRISGTGRR